MINHLARPLAAIALLFSVSLWVSPVPLQAQTVTRPPPLSDPAHADWQAIGRVNVGGFNVRGMCTGTLIAPDLVLTAAHCLYYRTGKTGIADPKDVYFLAGWHKGKAIEARAVSKFWLHPGFGIATSSITRIGFDLGLIRLAEPIPETSIAPLPVGLLLDDERPTAIIGYRTDRPHLLSADYRCSILQSDLRVMGLSCPVVPGNSGAPVLSKVDGKWTLVGVVSSRTTGSNGVRAVAARTDSAFIEAINDEN